MCSYEQYKRLREQIDKYEGGLEAFSRGYEKLGFTRRYHFSSFYFFHFGFYYSNGLST